MGVPIPLHVRQNLRSLGFSDQDVLIISYLFTAPKATLRQISRDTGINYSSTQFSVTHLQRLGLVKRAEGKEESFSLCTEGEFLDWIDDQRLKQDKTYEHTKADMKAFFSMKKEDSWRPNFMYYEGKKGIEEIYQDMLDSNSNIISWTDASILNEILGGDFLSYFVKERVKKNIETTSLIPDKPFNRIYSKNAKKRKSKLVKQLPINGEIRVYGDKVAVITFQKQHPVGLVIESMLIADMYRAIFKHSWENS